MRRYATLAAALVLSALTLVAAPATAGAKDGPSPRAEERAQTTRIQILGLNDFHGNLRPPDETSSSDASGLRSRRVSRPAASSTWRRMSASSRRPTRTRCLCRRAT